MSSRRLDLWGVPAVLCAVLTGMLVLRFVLPQHAGRVLGAELRPAPIVDLPVAVVPDYAAILARPLFTPGRAPGGAGSDATAASAQLSDFTVVGVAVAPRFTAAFVRGPGGEVRTLRPGDSLLGWKVAGVRRDAVVLEVEGRKRELPVSAAAQAQPLVSLR